MGRPEEGPLPPTTWTERLKGIAGGCVILAMGWWLVGHGVFYGISTRYRQPVFAFSAVAVGVVILAVSLAPARLTLKMTAIRKYRPYQRANERTPRIDQSS
jgi:hypothetical protein